MNSQPISVISEYKKLNLDFEELLNDKNARDKLLRKIEQEKAEIDDTLKATQFCYNQTPNQVNRQILETTNKESIKIKYRLIMLIILDLVATESHSYQEAKQKRERLLELIDTRTVCLKKLGEHVLVDPFARTKVKEQLNALLPMTDNAKTVSDIRKEIATLTSRTEEMTSQNNNYLILLSNSKNLIEDSLGFGDIDVTKIELPTENQVEKEIKANQIIRIRDINSKLNMSIVRQKTEAVITRVYQMMNVSVTDNIQTTDTYVPELVIVPAKIQETEQTFEEIFTPIQVEPVSVNDANTFVGVLSIENNIPNLTNNSESTDVPTESGYSNVFPVFEEYDTKETIIEKTTQAAENNEDLFETITPFAAPTMFNDRTDAIVNQPTKEVINFPIPEVKVQTEVETTANDEPSMPDSFWPTQEDFVTEEQIEESDKSLSFDEQINILMSSDNNNKVLKKVA